MDGLNTLFLAMSVALLAGFAGVGVLQWRYLRARKRREQAIERAGDLSVADLVTLKVRDFSAASAEGFADIERTLGGMAAGAAPVKKPTTHG